MQTPKHAFNLMCRHGEIWHFHESAWKCIRKNQDGKRYIDHSKTQPPRNLLIFHQLVQLSWYLYIGCIELVAPLLSQGAAEVAEKLYPETPARQPDPNLERLAEFLIEHHEHNPSDVN